jgi:hypothetical protein
VSPHSTTTTPTDRYDGFIEDGCVVLSDRRGVKKAEILDVSLKSETLGSASTVTYPPIVPRMSKRPRRWKTIREAQPSKAVDSVLRGRKTCRTYSAEAYYLSSGLIK